MTDTKRAISGGLLQTLAITIVALIPAMAWATPSTTYWAPSIATCQAFATPHVTYDTYYGNGGVSDRYRSHDGHHQLDQDSGRDRYDTLFPGANPAQVYVNGKVCIPENSMGKNSPAIGVGMYNIGFKKDVTTYNAFYVMAQKTLPFGGYIAGGFYRGLNDALFTNSEGKLAKTGAMVGWSSPDIKVGITGLSKILVLADVQTGKNILGAGGAGLDIYFNDYIGLIVGPVFFFDKGAAARWRLTLLDDATRRRHSSRQEDPISLPRRRAPDG